MRLLSIISSVILLALFNGCSLKLNKPVLSSELSFDLREIPFSYRGAGMALQLHAGNDLASDRIMLTDVSGNSDFGKGQIASIDLERPQTDTEVKVNGFPHTVIFSVERNAVVQGCFESSKILRLRGSKYPLLLQFNQNLTENKALKVTRYSENQYQLQLDFQFGTSRYLIHCLEGKLSLSDGGVIKLVSSDKGTYELAIEETDRTWMSKVSSKTFESCVSDARSTFGEWFGNIPAIPAKYDKAKKLGAYILWSSMLDAGGNLKRPGMLMSKNWMHYIWSWDHCFNAMACSYNFPDMAMDQYMILFDHQDAEGRLPDLIGRGRVITDYLKPPVHGWCFDKLMNQIDFSTAQLQEVYQPLAKWTEYWLEHMDVNNNGLPEYTHGNDSGWDNGSAFDINGQAHQRGHWESANLCAYLILQMDVLEKLASQLNQGEEAQTWKEKSERLLSLMIAEQWKGNQFVTENIDTGAINPESKSLMAYLPLVLGEKLPQEIRLQLVQNLKDSGHITKWGLATEQPNSSLYDDDGYWKGPIWAPSTMIIVDGLARCGEEDLAQQIAEKFCDLCLQNGFAENFNALTGEGLRDKSYTWTASVFFILAHEYLQEQASHQ